MWLTKLKIAIAQQDTKSLDELMSNIPLLKDKKEMQSAVYLLKEAIALVENLKGETQASMQQIKRSLDFLNSTKENKTSGFDITL